MATCTPDSRSSAVILHVHSTDHRFVDPFRYGVLARVQFSRSKSSLVVFTRDHLVQIPGRLLCSSLSPVSVRVSWRVVLNFAWQSFVSLFAGDSGMLTWTFRIEL